MPPREEMGPTYLRGLVQGSASCHRCPLDLSGPCSTCVRTLGPEPLLKVPAGIDRVRALTTYRGPGGRIVRSIKYANGRTPVADLGRAMAVLVPNPPDIVTWVPTTVERRGRRGFDQAQELARSVATALGRPCRRLQARAPGQAQTRLAVRPRRQGPHLRARTAASGSSVLLVDDVTTTGASLNAAAAALRAAGATSIEAVVVAATQPGNERARSSDRSIGSARGRTR